MNDDMSWCESHPWRTVPCWRCLTGRARRASTTPPAQPIRRGDYVEVQVPGQTVKRGRVMSVRTWPRVQVRLWSERLDRYVYGQAAYHANFLRVLSSPGGAP